MFKKIFISIFFIFNITTFTSEVTPPDFFLKDQFNIEQSLDKYKGKKVFLIFWTTWCRYCLEEIDIVKKLYQDFGGNKKDVIFLTFNEEEKEILNEFLKDKEISFPVINDKIIFKKYYIESYPTTFVINSEGKVINVFNGKLTLEEFKKLVENDKIQE